MIWVGEYDPVPSDLQAIYLSNGYEKTATSRKARQIDASSEYYDPEIDNWGDML